MSEDRKIVDLIGDQELKASETVEVIISLLDFNYMAFGLMYSGQKFLFQARHCR